MMTERQRFWLSLVWFLMWIGATFGGTLSLIFWIDSWSPK